MGRTPFSRHPGNLGRPRDFGCRLDAPALSSSGLRRFCRGVREAVGSLRCTHAMFYRNSAMLPKIGVMSGRALSTVDRALLHADRVIRTVCGGARATRPNPAGETPDLPLALRERRRAVALMRVNHAGEVAAQALYHGQALSARDARVRETLERAAREEVDHLAWCRERLAELGGRTSRLDPLWYAGSFGMGVLAGLAGDRWNLGFLVETERQVEAHLDGHLRRLPPSDPRSRAILAQMRADEGRHAASGLEAGGRALPRPVRGLMRRVSRVMTGTAYWV